MLGSIEEFEKILEDPQFGSYVFHSNEPSFDDWSDVETWMRIFHFGKNIYEVSLYTEYSTNSWDTTVKGKEEVLKIVELLYWLYNLY